MRQRVDLTKKIETKTTIRKTTKTTHFYHYPIYNQIETTETEEENNGLESEEELAENNNDADTTLENNSNQQSSENSNEENQIDNTQNDNQQNIINKTNNLNNKAHIINLNKFKTNTKSEGVKTLLKNPATIKIILIVLGIALVALGLLFIITIIMEYQMSSYKYLAGQCKTITVINTDCNNSGNCSNKYDGEVKFEDYIAGVVAADSGVNSNNIEYYKTIAIAARTYFYNNFSSDCVVEGNNNYQAYIDVEDSNYKETIKNAVEETKGLAMIIEEQFITGDYSTACVVDADNENYHIRYGSVTLEETGIQTIPKQWESTSVYNRTLEKYYSSIDKNNTDKYTKECPENTNDYGMSTIGALYLITKDNKTHKEVLKYYYGEAFELKNTNIPNSEIVNGFINPVNNATCSSSFGCRKHPISNDYESHMGIDLGAEAGEPIYATKDGKILSVTKNVPGYSDVYSYGNSILIEHDDGTRTRYAHMLYGSIPDDIKVGTKVQQGDIIGQVGSTGVSNGNHLHYEIHFNGELQDPIDYLDLSNIGNNKQCENNSNIDLSSCGL